MVRNSKMRRVKSEEREITQIDLFVDRELPGWSVAFRGRDSATRSIAGGSLRTIITDDLTLLCPQSSCTFFLIMEGKEW